MANSPRSREKARQAVSRFLAILGHLSARTGRDSREPDGVAFTTGNTLHRSALRWFARGLTPLDIATPRRFIGTLGKMREGA